MTNCNCHTVCRPDGLMETVGDRTYPAPTHLPSCPSYKLETFVRVGHDGSSMLMEPAEAEAMQRDGGGIYTLTDVMLTRDQFDAVPESAGF